MMLQEYDCCRGYSYPMEQRIILIKANMDRAVSLTHPRTTLTRHNSLLHNQLIHSHHAHSLSVTQTTTPTPIYPAGHFNGSLLCGAEGPWGLGGLQSEKKLPGVAAAEVVPASKHKRHTFPSVQTDSPSRFFLPPAVQSPLSRKITFTYRSPCNNAFPTSSFSYSLLQQSKTDVFQSNLHASKRSRNKLCPLQFAFFYNPKENTKDESNYLEAKMSLSTSFHGRMEQKEGCFASSSKMASTIATQSFNENRRSDFPPQDYARGIEGSLMSYFTSNQKPNLTDQVPRGKQLADTVILNNNYSFGGILHNTSLDREDRDTGAQECELRRWNNPVRFLIDTRDSQDLKQSIHEGPDIRLQQHRFEMLDGLGRQIKESSMSIHH